MLTIHAATVILLRDGGSGPEILMVERGEQLAFAGGALVFPGGRVDQPMSSPRATRRWPLVSPRSTTAMPPPALPAPAKPWKKPACC